MISRQKLANRQERQIDKIQRKKHWQTDRQKKNERQTSERQKERKRERQDDRKTERQEYRKRERQKERKTGRQKDRHLFKSCQNEVKVQNLLIDHFAHLIYQKKLHLFSTFFKEFQNKNKK